MNTGSPSLTICSPFSSNMAIGLLTALNGYSVTLTDWSLYSSFAAYTSASSPVTIMALKYLAGYSAWNTASNSLGVLLAQIRSGKVGGIFLKRALLDDYLYQTVIRSEFTSLVDDRWNIKDKKHAGSILQNLFKKHEEKLFRMYGEIFSYTVALRWNRTFEIEVEVKS